MFNASSGLIHPLTVGRNLILPFLQLSQIFSNTELLKTIAASTRRRASGSIWLCKFQDLAGYDAVGRALAGHFALANWLLGFSRTHSVCCMLLWGVGSEKKGLKCDKAFS